MADSHLESILKGEEDSPIMGMKFYNTFTRKKEAFKPVTEGRVGMYICGPTVYGSPHMGHIRTTVAYDALKEFFKTYKELDVLHVHNITDVGHIVGDVDDGEDKIEKAAKSRQVHPMEIVDTYIKEYWDGYDALKCSRPNIAPRATGHIIEMQDWCKVLLEKGYAYETDGDIYFDVSKFKNYGALSGNTGTGLIEGARVEINPKKRNPADFALWKKAESGHIMQWNSPWGKGYPGWHIECSVMSNKYLGSTFDIHGGARELSFPHHDNEIAQSEAYTGKKSVNYWVHTGVLNVNGEKMGKSKGNFITVTDLLKKYSPEKLRWFILSNQYSSGIDFTEATVSSTSKGLERINNFLFRLAQVKSSGTNGGEISGLLNKLRKGFEGSLDDDFNTPQAIGEIYTFIGEANKYLDKNGMGEREKSEVLSELKKMDSIFKAFQFESIGEESNSQDSEIAELIKQRNESRANKNWAEADRLRKLLQEKGIEVLDQKDGTSIIKKA